MAEFEALLCDAAVRMQTFADYRDPVEGETSYADNAALKARALRAQLRDAGIVAAVLADDSGMEVAALDGRPGVITADYGGAHLTWAERRSVILTELAALRAVDRAASFVCYLHHIAIDGRETAVHARVDGRIAENDRGAAGFSFDPIFIDAASGATFAELSSAQKNAISHRAAAVRALLATLHGVGGGRLDGEQSVQKTIGT